MVGFNVGINSGAAVGQTVMHSHSHLIPRRKGDNPNPRAGVRGVIPGKTDYKIVRSSLTAGTERNQKQE